MDEAEEEALFARLHQALKSGQRRPPPAGADAPAPEASAALARIEASLRTLAGGLDATAQRVGGLEKGLDSRVETAVARSTAALRIDMDRLEARLAQPGRARDVPAAPAHPVGHALLLAVLALIIVAIGGTTAWFGYVPGTGYLKPALASGVAQVRDLLVPPPHPAPAPKP